MNRPFPPLFALALLLVTGTTAHATDYAILIGVGKYERAHSLEFCPADINALQRVLTTRANLDETNILRMTDDSPENLRPTLVNWMRELPKFLQRVGPEDRLIVFFSGHGTRFGEGTYLAPREVDPRRIDETALPVETLRGWLTECPAEVKFLILDCCHSGENTGLKSLESDEIARAIEVDDIPGTVILASCRYREESLEWEARKQGLFTYWLCRALEGAATSADGKVTINRVGEYVNDRVKQLSPVIAKEQEVKNFRRQTPVISGEIEGNPPILELMPEPTASFARRIAEDLDADIRRQGLKSIGLFEFFLPSGVQDEHLEHATLPKYLMETVRQRLEELAGEDYQIVTEQRMQSATKNLYVEEIRQVPSLQRVQEEAKADAVIFGLLRDLKTKFSLKCELVSTATGQTLGQAGGVVGGVVRLSDTGLGDMGHNVDMIDLRAGGLDPYDTGRLERIFNRPQEGHPLQQSEFPFDVELRVNGSPVKLSYQSTPVSGTEKVRSDGVIEVENGDRIAISIRNRFTAAGRPQRGGMRLLLDGINSLGQQRTTLDQGPLWTLEPGQIYEIDGWYLPNPNAETGTNYERRPFEVVDVSDSVASREKFTEQIGLISFAFFEEGEDGRSIGIGEGSDITQEKLTTTEFKIGRCLAVFHIRYVEAK